nr:retrotransposon protein, putative, Ty1-copia subclass [Tanacetum cinerariifolium]
MSSIVKFDAEKFDGSNDFGLWRVKMRCLLIQHGWEAALDPFLETMTDADKTAALKTDVYKKAHSALLLCLDNKVLMEVNKEDFPAGVWLKLKTLYMTKSLANKLYLKKKLLTFYMHSGTHVTLLYGRESLTLEDVLSNLNSRKLKNKTNAKDDGGGLYVRGMLDHRGNQGRGSLRSKSKGKGTYKLKCYICYYEDHLKKDCPKKNKKKSTGFVKKNAGQGSGMHFEGYDNGDLLMAVSEERFLEWIMDSGGSFHMTPKRDFLFDFKEYGGTVLLGDNRACAIMGIGKVRVQMKDGSSFVLKNVRYISELKRNLISMETLDREGYTVKLQNGRVKVIKGSLMVLSGTMKGNCVNSLDSWAESGEASVGLHELENIKVLGNKGLGKLEFCENYVLGKSTRVSFGRGQHTIEGVIDYVHADLWGPSRVKSMSGCRYFLSIDDYSRRVWVHFLRHKNEAFSKFKEWKQLVENQTGSKVNKLRTDNGLEFCNQEFNNLCKKSGIARHLTVAGTPQQNGLAERMIRTLLNKGAGAANSRKEVEFEVELEDSRVEPTMDPHTGENPGNEDEEQYEEPQQQNLDNYVLVHDRAKRTTSIPARYKDEGNVSLSRPSGSKVADMAAYAFAIVEEEDTHKPITFQEAINSSDKDEWVRAMEEEMSFLMKNHTWELVDQPPGQKLVSCKWLYMIKEGIEGVQKPRYTARLVAQGFIQRAGIDYNEVFSPVVRHTSIRVILSLTACEDYELDQLDVKTAFLHGNFKETIYMRQPPGFKEGTGNKVCLLKKYLYGLKQSPRQWYKRFDVYMINNRFSRISYDSCVYFKEFAPGMYIYLLLYVDDMLIACKSKSEIEYTTGLLRKEFDMKELGLARKILGMKIVRDRGSRILKVSQSGYVQKILNNYRVDNGKSVSVQLGAYFKVSLKDCPSSDWDVERMSKNHWEAVKCILKYLKGTTDVGIVYGRHQRKHVDIDGFEDADYVKDPDKGRSITEYVFMLHGCVTTNRAGSNLRLVVVNCDNQIAIHLSRNAIFHEKTKHINVRYHFIREIVKSKEIKVTKIGTKDNASDTFTKVVSGPKFKYCMEILGVGIN